MSVGPVMVTILSGQLPSEILIRAPLWGGKQTSSYVINGRQMNVISMLSFFHQNLRLEKAELKIRRVTETGEIVLTTLLHKLATQAVFLQTQLTVLHGLPL